MATPADQRLLELLEKWQRSLDLHARYSALDDDAYWKVQPWVEHQRPNRWIIDLAIDKIRTLRKHVEDRIEAGDGEFSDALELMIFLANLVGSEHIERFIPVAEPQSERGPPAAADSSRDADPAVSTREMPKVPAARRAPDLDPAAVTREMPKLAAPKRPPAPAGTNEVARSERKGAEKPAAKPSRTAARPVPAGKAAPSRAGREQVVADAVRLAQWGRKWFEMPELIARMADRPSLAEVRRILKENKAEIDAQSKGT